MKRVRDEAHRFAITYHRELRGKAMTASELDDIAGVGPKRKKALLQGVRVAEEAPRGDRRADSRGPGHTP